MKLHTTSHTRGVELHHKSSAILSSTLYRKLGLRSFVVCFIWHESEIISIYFLTKELDIAKSVRPKA